MTSESGRKTLSGQTQSKQSDWRIALNDHLAALDGDAMLRQVRTLRHEGRYIFQDGRQLLNLAGNDYLGLAQHERLIKAVTIAAEQFGVGSGASRLVSGHHEIHGQVEQKFATFKHAEAALLFPTGYMANLGVLTSLAGSDDVILLDKLSHASLIDAANASDATVRSYVHLNYERLEKLLIRYRDARRRLIVTDSVFSMDGDLADLPVICDLAERHDAIVIVDEAHGTGVLGETGAGLCELQDVASRVDVVVSTASKALGSLGGIVTADEVVIDTLVNHARSFIYTTGVPPTQAAAIGAAIDIIQEEPARRARLQEILKKFRSELAGSSFGVEPDVPTPIVPLVVGSAQNALSLAKHLSDAGIYAPAIRPPTVAPNTSRVRLTLRADLTDEEIDRTLASIKSWSRT